MPTAQQLAGDFSDTRLANGNLSPIYNPFHTYPAPNEGKSVQLRREAFNAANTPT